MAVRSVSVRPMRDRRRKRVEARAADESGPLLAVWFNQPWIARQLGEGSSVLLHGRLRRRGEFWVSEHEPLGEDAPVHTVGLVPVHPATEGLSAGRLRALVWDARGRFLLTPEPLPATLRVSEALPERAGRPRGRALPGRARRTRTGPGGGSPSRSSCCSSWRWPGGGARAGRRAAPARSMPAAGGGPLALVAALRAHGRPESGALAEIDEDLAPRPADAAPADGRGRRREDRRCAARDAAGRGERRPGRADGAHRDAGGAAPPRRSTGSWAAHCRWSCSRAPRPPRGAAICSGRSARARSSSWSARTP